MERDRRCEDCWAAGAARWSWNGLRLNAFPHQAHRGHCSHRREMDQDEAGQPAAVEGQHRRRPLHRYD